MVTKERKLNSIKRFDGGGSFDLLFNSYNSKFKFDNSSVPMLWIPHKSSHHHHHQSLVTLSQLSCGQLHKSSHLKFKPFKTSASLVLTLGKIQLKLETPHRSRVEHMVKIKPEVKFHVYR